MFFEGRSRPPGTLHALGRGRADCALRAARMRSAAAAADLIVHTTRFCRLLREHGLLATPGDSVDAARVLGLVDVTDRADFHAALRSVLVHRREDMRAFDECFDVFW